jgi:hypothetical protein
MALKSAPALRASLASFGPSGLPIRDLTILTRAIPIKKKTKKRRRNQKAWDKKGHKKQTKFLGEFFCALLSWCIVVHPQINSFEALQQRQHICRRNKQVRELEFFSKEKEQQAYPEAAIGSHSAEKRPDSPWLDERPSRRTRPPSQPTTRNCQRPSQKTTVKTKKTNDKFRIFGNGVQAK